MTTELAIRILTGDVLGTSEQTHEAVEMAIKALSAQPERKKGKWIECDDEYWCYYRYSECGNLLMEITTEGYNYCPNCGAEMMKGASNEKR